MGIAPVGKAIINLALPMIVAMLAQAVYSLTDMFFIGQTGNPNMLAAVSLAFPIFMLSQAIGNIFAIGGSSYISRKLGEKQESTALHTSSVSFYIALFAGILISIVLYIFRNPIIWIIGASDATFGFTQDYFQIIVLSIGFATTGVVMSGIMRSEGAAKNAMILQLIGIILNILFDTIFILGLNMGTTGAALATVIGQGASFIYGIYYFASKKSILSIRLPDFKPDKPIMGQILSIGIPAGASSIIMSVSNILCNRIAASYGDYVVAGYGVQMRIASIIFMIVLALAMGYQPFAGYNYGAKQFLRLRQGFKLTLIYSSVLCIIGSFVLWLFGPDLIRFFINDIPTIEAGAVMLRVFIWGLPFIGAQMTLMVSFQALGKPIQAMIITLGRQLLFYIPLLYLLNYTFGFSGFIWAQPIADILTTIIAIVLGLSLFKILRDTDSVFSNQI